MRLRKLLMLVLMLILPLQGAAALVAPLTMLAANGATATPAVAAMPCHDYGARHQPVADGTAPGTPADNNHLCCHVVFSATAANTLNTVARKFSDVTRAVLPLTTLFIADSPDRPPRG